MEIAKTFGVEPILLLAQVVNFLLVLFLLNKLLYKPLVTMLEERKKRIAEAEEHAQQIEQRMRQIDEEQSRILVQAKQEADKVLAETKQSAKALAEEINARAKAQAQSTVSKAQTAAQLAYEEKMQQLKKDILTLAVDAAEKATKQVLTKEQQLQLTKEAAKELAS